LASSLACIACMCVLLTPAAPAQSKQQGAVTSSDGGGPVAGPLVSYTEESATLTVQDGQEVVVTMTHGWTVSKPHQMTIATIKKGDFVATGNQPIDDHTGKCTELRIFEPGYERDYGTKAARNGRVETHGTVSTVEETADGVELNVQYPGGSRHLVVPASLKVTRFDPLSRDVLKPGMVVRAVLLKDADGIYRAGRLTLSP
jgi:hypothetical protein